jgi:hypothetical protein
MVLLFRGDINMKEVVAKQRYQASPAIKWLRIATGNPDLNDKTAQSLAQCIKCYLRYLGCYATEIDHRGFWQKEIQKFVPSRTDNGAPDIFACIFGRFVGIEIKIGSDRMRPAQIETATDIQNAKGYFIVVGDFEKLLCWVQNRIDKVKEHGRK